MSIAIADKSRAGLMGPEHAKTLAKAVTTDGAQTITGAKTFSTDTFIVGGSTIGGTIFLEIGSTVSSAAPAIIDFHSNGATSSDYDTRLRSDNGNGTAGNGTFTITTGTLQLGHTIFSLPARLASYTVATLPSAATYVRGLIYVSDGTGNKRLAISDGTNWRWPDGAIVS